MLLLNYYIHGQVDTIQKLVLEGHYQGVNIFIQNPFSSDQNSLCVEKVLVNDSLINTENTASAFEIKLTELNLKIGESVRVEILHQGDCLPRAIYIPPPKQTVEFLNIEIVE